MHARTQKICAWSGFIGTMIFFTGLLFAGWFPPPSPSLSPQDVADMYQQNTTGIRIGTLLIMISGMFIAPMVAVITVQMKRIEGKSSVLAYTQLSAGTAGILFFVLPGLMFLITAYRPDRPIDLTYMMNDMSWFVTVLVWPMAFMQNVALGFAILNDKRAEPVFPRWLGYFNFWVAVLFVPASLLAFVYVGPFAWNGLFPFWIPAFVFGGWYVVLPIMLVKAIEQQQLEAMRA
jgi:hypothetical protein